MPKPPGNLLALLITLPLLAGCVYPMVQGDRPRAQQSDIGDPGSPDGVNLHLYSTTPDESRPDVSRVESDYNGPPRVREEEGWEPVFVSP